MDKSFKIFAMVFFIFILTFALIAEDYTADMIMKMQGKTINSKVYVSNGKVRKEMSMNGSDGVSIFITRPDKQVAWIVMPKNMYIEQSLKPSDMVVTKDKAKGEVERKNLGKEKINGINTDKYRITYKSDDGKTSVMIAWFDKDGIMVKMTDEKETYSVEYTNFKKGKQPESLFELPKDCKKFEMPNM
jgi:hypothetical protein